MEKSGGSKEAGGPPSPLPPPPPAIPPNVKPERVTTTKYTITSRRGVGTTGRPIQLLSNHFKVHVDNPDAVFYQYSVCLSCFFFSLLESIAYYISVLNFICHTFIGIYYWGRKESC